MKDLSGEWPRGHAGADLACVGWEPKACILEQLTGDAPPAGLRMPLWVSSQWFLNIIFITTFEVGALLQRRPFSTRRWRNIPELTWLWTAEPGSHHLKPELTVARKWMWHFDLHPESSVVSPCYRSHDVVSASSSLWSASASIQPWLWYTEDTHGPPGPGKAGRISSHQIAPATSQ